jgi:hypothetical protein
MDAGLQMMILMGLILKIPVLGAAWLIWHAVRAEPDPAEAVEDEGGSEERRHFRREPKRPRGPRRGPHAPDALPIPCADGEGQLQVLRRRPGAVPLTASSRERH